MRGATSSGSPTRPRGCTRAAKSSSARSAPASRVRTTAGAIALTQGELPGQVDETRLGDVVRAHHPAGSETGDRRHVDDGPAVLSHPCLVCAPDPEQRGPEVDGPGLVQGTQVDLHEITGGRVGAGVVHQDVEGTEPLDGGRRRRLGGFLVVGPRRQGKDRALVHTGVDHLLPGGLDGLFLASGDDHALGPAAGELEGRGEPDAPAGTRDEGDLSRNRDLHGRDGS